MHLQLFCTEQILNSNRQKYPYPGGTDAELQNPLVVVEDQIAGQLRAFLAGHRHEQHTPSDQPVGQDNGFQGFERFQLQRFDFAAGLEDAKQDFDLPAATILREPLFGVDREQIGFAVGEIDQSGVEGLFPERLLGFTNALIAFQPTLRLFACWQPPAPAPAKVDPRLDTGEDGKPLKRFFSEPPPTQTFTLQYTPSFARRDNVLP